MGKSKALLKNRFRERFLATLISNQSQIKSLHWWWIWPEWNENLKLLHMEITTEKNHWVQWYYLQWHWGFVPKMHAPANTPHPSTEITRNRNVTKCTLPCSWGKYEGRLDFTPVQREGSTPIASLKLQLVGYKWFLGLGFCTERISPTVSGVWILSTYSPLPPRWESHRDG